MNHPALLHHGGAPPLGVFDGLDHPHQWDVAAGGGARRKQTVETPLVQCAFSTCRHIQ